jgi:bacterial/archaeal transporter family-2 protein
MPFLLILLVVASALGQPIQIAANSRLREAVQSPALSALVAFVVGGMLLAVLVMLGVFERGDLRGLTKVPWWAWTGGVLAVFSILAGIVALPSMSSATIIGAAIFGQLIASMVIDHFGWFNVPVVPINTSRIIGAVLLLIGASDGCYEDDWHSGVSRRIQKQSNRQYWIGNYDKVGGATLSPKTSRAAAAWDSSFGSAMSTVFPRAIASS